MSEQKEQDERRLAAANGELPAIVRQRFPSASFQVGEGEDPEGTYLTAIVDVDDTDEVMAVVVARLVTMQVDEHLPLYFIPLRPSERVERELSTHTQTGGLDGWLFKMSDSFLTASSTTRRPSM
ncbi:MAG: hypothetical protein EXR51_05595 [Dehalococcoidia bacterium]|nr:hypothetical protein [Dehalococcoidia bacterium]